MYCAVLPRNLAPAPRRERSTIPVLARMVDFGLNSTIHSLYFVLRPVSEATSTSKHCTTKTAAGVNLPSNRLNAGHEQGRFWEFHCKLFSTTVLNAETFLGYASELGLEQAGFEECISSRRYQDEVVADLDWAVQPADRDVLLGADVFKRGLKVEICCVGSYIILTSHVYTSIFSGHWLSGAFISAPVVSTILSSLQVVGLPIKGKLSDVRFCCVIGLRLI